MLDVYVISDRYVEYLRIEKGFTKVYDSKVFIRKHTRKYIGIVLRIGMYNYFAPFSSPKEKDFNDDGSIKKSTISILRMVKDNKHRMDGKELLGTITINNMIPVPEGEYFKYDLNNETDIAYKNLVIDEIRWIEKNDNEILNKSRHLYFLKINEAKRKTPRNYKMLEVTMDFKKIEKACDDWELTKKI